MDEQNEEVASDQPASILVANEPSSSSEDSDLDSPSLDRTKVDIRENSIRLETQRRERREQARIEALENVKKAKTLDLARKHFHSHAGIIYVPDEFWTRLWRASGPCHLYVSLQSLQKSSEPRVQSVGYLPDQGPPTSGNMPTSLPPRIKIVNKILHKDMQIQCGFKDEYPTFNIDHVAPFRSIIPSEQILRRRYLETQKAFSEAAAGDPKHPAVLREEVDWVPISVSPDVTYPVIPVEPSDEGDLDEVSRARILLDGYRALIYLLDHEFSSLVQDYRQIQTGKIETLPFLHLWHLFRPGQEIVTNGTKVQAYRVLQITGGRRLMRSKEGPVPPGMPGGPGLPRINGPNQTHTGKKRTVSDLVIDCFRLEFDGESFGPIPITINIKPYEGARAIRQLAAYPLALAADSRLFEILTERGKKFEQMVKVSHWKYNGLTLREKEPFDIIEEIDGDVMVDFQLAYRDKDPSRRIDRPAFNGGVIDEPTEEIEAEIRVGDYEGGVVLNFDDTKAIRNRWTEWSRKTNLLDHYQPGTLTAEHYNLLPARAWAYVFLRRKWYPLDVDFIQPVQTVNASTADGFEKLVLPPGHKDIVRALVKTHAKKQGVGEAKSSNNMQREFDIVKGKGKGLIILLHGAPGVGKTSTAECVATNAGKPLFPITIGDVGGHSAQEVERNLEKYFDFARKWNCVLLLDEADVFLSTRVAGNITQNSLVSVFLRALEYYSGILILTTNRVGSFDEAIKSRVHCALYYPPLDKDQTMRVWQMNLNLLDERNAKSESRQRIQFERKEIEEYARTHWKKGNRSKFSNRWNGRQIKNAFQTAVALADWDNLTYTNGEGNPNGTVLKPEHFEKVATASEHFDMYLERTRTSDKQRARDDGAREDDAPWKLHEPSESSEETESSEEDKKKKKSTKKSSAKKKATADKKRSKSKKKVEESDEKSSEESGSEEE